MGSLGPLFALALTFVIMLRDGESRVDDHCGERVALRHLKDFHPFVGRTERVSLEVTDVTKTYQSIANYTEQTLENLNSFKTRMVAGQPKCEMMFFWPDKYLCLMKSNHATSKAAWECELIGYTIYRPLNRERDRKMFEELKKKGILSIPSVMDAAGQSVLNADGEFLIHLADRDQNETENTDSFPVVVSLGTKNNVPQLVISLNDNLWEMPEESRVLCETEPIPYEKGNPLQPAFEHTAEEFIESSSELILKLRSQFKETNSTNTVEFGYPKLKLRLSGITRKVLKSTHRLSGARNWRKEEVVSSLYPTLIDFGRLPLSNDGVTYEIDIQDVKQARMILNVGTDDYVDPRLLFRVDKIVMNHGKRFAYGNLTARLASHDKVLKQYVLLPYNNLGRVVDERFMYDWNGEPFVSNVNVEYDEGCLNGTCDLNNFLSNENARDRSCANFLLKKGGGEGSCRYKDHPWPVAYRLVCDGNVTSIVSSPKPVSIRVDCSNMQSKDVLFSMGQTLFESVCELIFKGVTLLPLELSRGPKFIPDSYIDPNANDYMYHVQYSAIGLLFGMALIGVYAACRIFKHLPFCCCSRFCGINCRDPENQGSEGDCADNISLASFASRSGPRGALRFRSQYDPNAPPPDYGEISRRLAVSEPTGGYRTLDRRDLLGNRDLADFLEARHQDPAEEEDGEEDLLGAAAAPRLRSRAEAPEARGQRRQ